MKTVPSLLPGPEHYQVTYLVAVTASAIAPPALSTDKKQVALGKETRNKEPNL